MRLIITVEYGNLTGPNPGESCLTTEKIESTLRGRLIECTSKELRAGRSASVLNPSVRRRYAACKISSERTLDLYTGECSSAAD